MIGNSPKKRIGKEDDSMAQDLEKQPNRSGRQFGLVLEGGGMRGIYTAGVLDVFLEKGIAFDGVIGVSAGAIHGCSYVSGQRGRSIRYYKKYCQDKRFMSMRNLILTGDIAGEQFCYHELPEKLDPYDYDAFCHSETEFYVTCTNVETGRAEYLRVTDMKAQIDLVRASASLPYVSRIVKTAGYKLLDGGCSDSIPVEAFRNMGFIKTVVVMTRPKGYIKQPERRQMARVYYRNYPAFVKTLENRHREYNQTVSKLEELARNGEIFLIRPGRDLHIGRTEQDPVKIQHQYDLGRADALCQVRDLQKWMGGRMDKR